MQLHAACIRTIFRNHLVSSQSLLVCFYPIDIRIRYTILNVPSHMIPTCLTAVLEKLVTFSLLLKVTHSTQPTYILEYSTYARVL